MNRLGMQYKAFELKAFDVNSRKISGYAAIFGNIDKAKDKLIKGCFSKSIEDRGPLSSANDKIILLWQHDQREPIGRITELKEDEKGLYFEAVLDEIEQADRVLKQLESGTLNQFSIGYTYVWENCKYDSDELCTIVKEVKLYEISVVSIGCNAETCYLGLKSAEDISNAEAELTKEIASFTKRLDARKQAHFQSILSKALSLADLKPKPISLEEKGADEAGRENKKSFFDFKLKKA